MKDFARAQPEIFGFVVFIVISVAGGVVGVILAMLIASLGCGPQGPSDPCDGPAMAAGAILTVVPLAGFISGIIIGICSYVKFRHQGRQRLP